MQALNGGLAERPDAAANSRPESAAPPSAGAPAPAQRGPGANQREERRLEWRRGAGPGRRGSPRRAGRGCEGGGPTRRRELGPPIRPLPQGWRCPGGRRPRGPRPACRLQARGSPPPRPAHGGTVDRADRPGRPPGLLRVRGWTGRGSGGPPCRGVPGRGSRASC